MDKSLQELVRQERLEYFRKWRSENKDKVQKHNTAYWIRRAMKRMEDKNGGGGDIK